jgi:hypothetical protein
MTDISVVMPTFNQKDFVMESVRSVLSQTWADFELIIINDGSNDGTEQLLEEINDPRVTVVHQENRGVHAAINTGFNRSKGRYLTCVSSDNLMLPRCLEHCRDYLETHPDIALVYTDFQNIDDQGCFIDYMHSEPYYPGLLQVNPGAVGVSFLFKHDVYRCCGEFRDYVCNDLDFWLRAARLFTFAYLPEVLSANRKHAGMQTMVKMKRIGEQVENLLEQERGVSGPLESVCVLDSLTRLRRISLQLSRAVSLKKMDRSEPMVLVGENPLASIVTCILSGQGISVEHISPDEWDGNRQKLYMALSPEIEIVLEREGCRLVRLAGGDGVMFGKQF